MDILTIPWADINIPKIILEAIPMIISTFVGTWIVRRSFLPKVVIKTKKEHIL